MREMLFRGKRKDNGEWVEGGIAFEDYTDKVYIVRWNTFGLGYFEYIEVDTNTISQSTALYDKNGKKIFEGDIVKSVFTGKFYPVCFGEYTYVNEYGDEEGACGWYNEEEHGYLTAFAYPGNWAIVVGNIHDNPELLED